MVAVRIPGGTASENAHSTPPLSRIAQSVLAYCGISGGVEHYDAIADYVQYHVIEGLDPEEAFCKAYEDRPALLRQCSGIILRPPGEAFAITTNFTGPVGKLPKNLLGEGDARPPDHLRGYRVPFYRTRIICTSRVLTL